MEIDPISPTKALFVAMLTAAIALVSAFAVAGTLRDEALATSHQRPIEERIFESETPTSPALVALGRKLFLGSCAHCHGADARGDEGPDLHRVQVSDRYIANVIKHGIPHEMPSFEKKLHAPEISELTVYIRSLSD
jgi:mono/diheme cytochrome c family protein